jgi:ribosomal protein L30E
MLKSGVSNNVELIRRRINEYFAARHAYEESARRVNVFLENSIPELLRDGIMAAANISEIALHDFCIQHVELGEGIYNEAVNLRRVMMQRKSILDLAEDRMLHGV